MSELYVFKDLNAVVQGEEEPERIEQPQGATRPKEVLRRNWRKEKEESDAHNHKLPQS